MNAVILTSAERARARFVLGREARALGVDRSLFRASSAGTRELPERVAAVVRHRAPNYAVALATAGCPTPLHDALVALFGIERAKGDR